MKKTLLTAVLALIGIHTTFAQIGIGTIEPDASAQLELQSTAKGFLPPRMDTDARDGIGSPAEGLTIYNTDNKCLEVFDNADWISICDGSVVTSPPYSESYVHCDTNNPTEIVEVISTTGKIWMDRNLGASRVATSTTDSESLGDLFQWGRFADGHQCRDSANYSTGLADTSAPVAGNAWDEKFILSSDFPRDWVNPQDNDLWQGIDGKNNPCPLGYRIPTKLELVAELTELTENFSADALGAFQSPLKLPISGNRSNKNSYLNPTIGRYWSSTADANQPNTLYFTDTSSAIVNGTNRSEGVAIRCIKN